MPELNVIINLYKCARLPKRHFSRQSVTFTIGLTISCSDNRNNRLSGQSGKCAIDQALLIQMYSRELNQNYFKNLEILHRNYTP